MLPIDSYSPPQIAAVQEACSYLFKTEQVFDSAFIRNLKSDDIHKSYLLKKVEIKQIIKGVNGEKRQKKAQKYLNRMGEAHFLLSTLASGEHPAGTKDSKSKIIAVGGAKGGIGKSIFAANLSVFLAQKGFSTIAVDLDLGGANLAIYLGENYILERTIFDFLRKKYASLEDIIIQSRFGPGIIGGNSSELGAANIHHAKKIKLIRAIKSLKADFIVLDLGGDISFNMLDFFLLADYGMVVSTRDSASIIGAYQFIKTALYRKINRLPSQSSASHDDIDPSLSSILKKCTLANGQPMSRTISSLIDTVAENDSLDIPQIIKPIVSFKPHLIINKAANVLQANQVVNTVSDLAKRYLSISIDCPGYLNHHSEIDRNLRNNIPLAAQSPNGELGQEISNIATNAGLF